MNREKPVLPLGHGYGSEDSALPVAPADLYYFGEFTGGTPVPLFAQVENLCCWYKTWVNMLVYVGRDVTRGGGPPGSIPGDELGSMMALRLRIRLRRIDPDESGEACPTPRTRVWLRRLRPTRGTR